MRVVWGRQATNHLHGIVGYIRERSPAAAAAVASRIEKAASGLSDMPERFKKGALSGTREQVVPGLPYILVYQIESDRVLIRALFHVAQDKPRGG